MITSILPLKKYGVLTLAAFALVSCNNKENDKKADTPELRPLFENLTATPPATQTAAPVSPLSVSADGAATTTAPGMNPPHGQPGHRCEIPVGAPLNSASPTGTQAVAPQTTPQQPPAFMPPGVAESNQPATTAPGMNPPHGQPGHRCDVAVGAPLP